MRRAVRKNGGVGGSPAQVAMRLRKAAKDSPKPGRRYTKRKVRIGRPRIKPLSRKSPKRA